MSYLNGLPGWLNSLYKSGLDEWAEPAEETLEEYAKENARIEERWKELRKFIRRNLSEVDGFTGNMFLSIVLNKMQEMEEVKS